MQESVTYQAIIRKGVQQGKQEGKKEEALSLIMRLLARRLGAVDPQMQERIQALPIAQLEELGEALLDFTAASDLAVWFEEHQS
ncbi:DUF4351 domain-containing protein [Coleofasciculus sp. H7-2]|uniref:DUF4351 domain-containing protein n=1 Tax=Coleofasciculus sp. H7-2 TaxID=3351545 RepID=UPI00366BFF84